MLKMLKPRDFSKGKKELALENFQIVDFLAGNTSTFREEYCRFHKNIIALKSMREGAMWKSSEAGK